MRRNLLLTLFSILLLTLFFIGSEFLVRGLYPEINFQGIDRELVKENVFGKTWGWQPDATGICFGKETAINHDGFRKLGEESDQDSVILLIGDSVLFGVGVDAESTFAALLQQATPTKRVVNAGVVGYSVREYADVADSLMAHMKVATALIFFSLNDFYDGKPRTVHSLEIASFLRRNSKLYLLLKNVLFDRSKTYFEYDASFYHQRTSEVETALAELAELRGRFMEQNIPCSVVVLPYEYQLRTREERDLQPQQIIRNSLSTDGIKLVDMYEDFVTAGVESQELFLYGDHMHLSASGHRVVFERIARELR